MMSSSTAHSSPESVCSLGFCRMRGGLLQTCSGAFSDVGPVRAKNDDLVFAGDSCRLFVALDGIGGQAGGDEASRILLSELRIHIETMCSQATGAVDSDLRGAVVQALGSATRAMLRAAKQTPAYDRMGTVFALAYIVNDTLFYTHVGDCRVYLLRDQQLHQLTSDQTYVQLMVDVGVIDPDDVEFHPMRNVVLNAVGTRPAERDPVVHATKLATGDVVVLTTDGVSDVLNECDFRELLAEPTSAQQAAEQLVGRAIDAGSRDNASCVVVQLQPNAETDDAAANDHHAGPHVTLAANTTQSDNEALEESTMSNPTNSAPNADDGAGKTDDQIPAALDAELAKLREMLAATDLLDDRVRQDLSTLAADIRNAVDNNAHEHLPDLREQLNQQTLEFEVSHPHLTQAIASIVNLLSNAGI